MFDSWVSFSSIDNLTARGIDQFENSLYMKIVNYFTLVSTTSWTFSKHDLRTIDHHFDKPFNHGFVNQHVVRADTGLA